MRLQVWWRSLCLLFFFFNDTATTEIYTLSLHDALPISRSVRYKKRKPSKKYMPAKPISVRSEEHTSELQSRENLVCRLLLEKQKDETEVREHEEANLTEHSPEHITTPI